jgi:DNA-directed RNA polymerase subunit RPC12/RpoP
MAIVAVTCPNCGASIKDAKAFNRCAYCGSTVRVEDEKDETREAIELEFKQKEKELRAKLQTEYERKEHQKKLQEKQSGRLGCFLLLLFTLGLALIIMAIIFFVRADKLAGWYCSIFAVIAWGALVAVSAYNEPL